MHKIFDISSMFGVLAALGLMAVAMSLGDSSVMAFWDTPSVLIVLGGTIFLTMACFNFHEVFSSFGVIARTVVYSAEDASRAGMAALEIATTARKHGLLELQKHEHVMAHNDFFTKAVMMVVDGVEAAEVERVLGNEISAIADRHRKGVTILKKAAEIAPAMGLIGTLIGLVQMLGHLSDPASIGPSMAVALITTFYGAVMAFMICTPLAAKLERNTKEELLILTIYMNAALSIARKENPRRLEMLVNAVLPPSKRIKYFAS